VLNFCSYRHYSPTFTSFGHYPTWSGNLSAVVANLQDAPVKPEHDWVEWQLLNFSPFPAVIPDILLFLSLPDLIG
jgi:hypothetical protein